MTRLLRRSLLRSAPALASLAIIGAAQAAPTPTDISQTPLIVTNAALVKPNIMLLMDNSDSMGRTHMPDEAESVMGVRSIGYKSAQCNALYYSPTGTYLRPKKYDGALFPAPDFTAAPYAGYGAYFATPDLSVTDLRSQFVPYDWGKNTVLGPVAAPPSMAPSPGFAAATPGPAYYYVYTGPETLKYDSAPCNQLDTGASVSTPGGGTWTRIDVSLRSVAEQRHFALWYSFYRTRLGLTKSAASLAFAPLDVSKRVGFITVEPKINPTDSAIDPNRYLPIADFSTVALGQKEQWYKKLFSQKSQGRSPTREGLARVGRYYGGDTDGINTGMDGPDPVQYACQQNFTILTTDGYWNGNTESPGGGGIKLDRDGAGLVGQQDGNPTCSVTDPYCVRPIFDGNSADILKVTDKNNAYTNFTCPIDTIYRHVVQQQRKVYNITRDTSRTQQETIQFKRSSSQLVAASVQTVKTTKQTQKTVDQYWVDTTTESKERYQIWKSEDKIVRDTEQYQLQTRQQTAQTLRNVEVKTQTTARYEQWQTASTQYVVTTTQFRTSTTNYRQSKTQTYKRQWQYIGQNSRGETSEPLPSATCPAGYTCAQYDSFPIQLVDPATCPSSNVSGYNSDPTLSYVHTECTPGPQDSGGDQAVMACSIPPNTTDPARNGNSWVKTVCTANTTTPDYASGYTVATCAPSSQSNTPPYTITNCTVVQNSSVPQAASCTPTGPHTTPYPYVTTECTRPPATNYAATNSAPCNESAGPQTNTTTWVTTVCTKPVDHTDPAPPLGAGCTNDPGTASPYMKVTCGSNSQGNTPKSITACTNTPGSGPNLWIKTECQQTPVSPTPTATAVQWGSCTAGPNSGAYAYDTVCSTSNSNNQTNFVAASTCGGTTYSNYATGSPWIDSFCTKPAGANNVIGAAWNPADGTCPSNAGTAPPFARSTCTPVSVSAATPVEASTCPSTSTSTNSPYITTTCLRQDLAATFTCPGTTPTGYPWIYETCGYGTMPAKVAYGSCTPGSSAGLAANQMCRREVGTAPAASCVDDPTPSGTNPKVTCAGPTVIPALSGPTDPASCPATNGPQGGTDQYDVSCVTSPHGTYATPKGVATCPTPTMDPVTFDVTTCSNPTATNFSNVDSAPCTVENIVGNSGNDYISRSCSRSDVFVDMAAAVCAPTAHAQSGTGSEVKCVPNGGTTGEPVNSCVIGNSDPSPPYATVTMCYSTQSTAAWNNFGGALCVAGNGSTTGEQYDCRNVPTGADVADPTCTNPTGPDATGLITTCPHITGNGTKYKVSTTTTITRTPMSGGSPSGPTQNLFVPGSPTTPTDVDGVCYASPQTIPSAAFPAKPSVSIAGCTAWPCSETIPSAGGSLNSLADVAQYYYVTDLRPTMDNIVPPAGTTAEDDTAPHQHMTTFVVALGVNGTLRYRTDYKTAAAGDFTDIRTGAKDWPLWPDPNLDYSNVDNYNDPKSIDDFWHTAVNGRGRYFNANDPTTVIQGLADALAKVGTLTASGAADAISSLTPVAGNNYVFGTSYESGSWSGDLEAFTIDPVTGALSTPHAWSAKALLDNRTFAACDNRKIFLLRGGNSLVDFAWNTDECPGGTPTGSLATTLTSAEMANFSPSNIALLSQFTAYLPTDPQLQAAQAPGVLLNFLRGQRGNEDYVANSTTRLFRKRSAVLGDLVDSQPVYVKQPFANYVDAGYDNFKTTQANRTPMVYVGGNDGMVHAFYATFASTDPTYPLRGQEAWSVIPSEVLPKLYQLADINYERGNHQFFVDGTPVASDVYDGTDWHTILVGGLNAGGKGYYAIDVTNPASPAALWEFRQDTSVCPATSAAAAGNKSDCNMGLSFSKPVVTKLGTTWVVMFTSGYNNINGAAQGDGQGFLYVVNALSGAIIHKIATGAGSPTAPSGLGQINNYVDNVLVNNATLRVYGGDLLGNVWRFEFTPTPRAVRVGTATTAASVAQPITTRPELAELNGEPFLLVGTGKLLGITDVSDHQPQAVYGIHDKLTVAATGSPPAIYPSLRSALKKMRMTQIGTGLSAVRTVACISDCSRTDGWVVDLAEAGERVNVDMKLVLGTLVFPSNVPEGVPCSVGGHSWLNQLDFRTGQAVTTAPLSGTDGIISNYLADSLNQGINVVQLQPPSGQNNPTYQTEAHQGDSTRRMQTTYVAPPLFIGKRISWREVVQ